MFANKTLAAISDFLMGAILIVDLFFRLGLFV